LLVTAISKFASSFGSAAILHNLDPIMAMPFQNVFRIVGAIELIVVYFCFFGKRAQLQAILVAWLATCFLAYRIGMIAIGYRKPCSCMGNLTDALHIPPQNADVVMRFILAYLLIGSYGYLFWLWRQHKKASLLPAK